MLYNDTYACSAVVDVDFGGKKVIAKDCFSPDQLPAVHQKVECLMKVGGPVTFEGCVRSTGRDVTVSIHSKLTSIGVADLINRIKSKM